MFPLCQNRARDRNYQILPLIGVAWDSLNHHSDAIFGIFLSFTRHKGDVLQQPFPRFQRQNLPLFRLIWHRKGSFEQDFWDYLSLFAYSWWDWDADTIPLLCLCSVFVSPPFQVRFKSLPKNGRKMGFGRDLQGNCMGLAWELRETDFSDVSDKLCDIFSIRFQINAD